MQKLFGPRSQEIQLSSDDEEEFAGDLTGMSTGFGCVSCLPRFAMMGGSGTIRLPTEDATLDDYLDPNTTTTIEPLLEEYNSQQTDNAFNGAALQDSQQFLTRNPFASSATSSATTNDRSTQHTFENSNGNDNYHHDSYQEQQQQRHSFAGALPRVDFFLENDDNDAEFLSDHRISAVIGDSSKLASQFEVFDAQDKNEPLLQDDCSESIVLDHQGGEDEQDDDNTTATTASAQPFEIQNDWIETLDPDSTVDSTQHEQHDELRADSNEGQQQTNLIDESLTDIPAHAEMITSEIESRTASPINTPTNDSNNNNKQTIDDIDKESKLSADVCSENAGTGRDMGDLTCEMKSMTISIGNNADKDDTKAPADISLDDSNVSDADMELPSLSSHSVGETAIQIPHSSNSTQLTDTKQLGTKRNDATNENITMIPTTNKSESSITSSPPSPMPSLSTENATRSFPSTGLSRTPIPIQSLDNSSVSPPSPTNVTDIEHGHHEKNDNKQDIDNNNEEDTNRNDTTSPSSDTSNAAQSLVVTAAAAATETESNINMADGKRRSSVAAVAHSLLGDKLDDFTEKLAYIRKNIIMSLDDDEDNDDYYDEDMAKLRQQQHQQLRRSRSGSMQQEMRRQSFDPSVSSLSGNTQQHQRPLSRTDIPGDPRTQHRRSNSLMDGATSFAKIFQQMGGQQEGESNHQRHFSPSSFFASLAGPDIPPSSSSSNTTPRTGLVHTTSASPLPRRSSSMSSSPPLQQHQYPAVSRSANHLHTTSQQPPPRHYSNNETSLHNVNEEENIDEEDLFDFSKMIAMGKNVRNMSEDLMGNGIRLFNDFSTRMKNANANANRMTPLDPSSSSNTQSQQQRQYHRQPLPQQQQQEQQEQQTSSIDQEFLLGDTYI
ncbi:hypothetical protein BCR42DRAFT_447015 [Absidia repens]|uniref:Uncharacterized protein n=1 Tax=Absidia repens TaxID=90262 RepID=A0A1X2IW97_9FUNG|nr:hypothetical protein BCR42DRAFT_447015 [Absidia repens]